MNFHFPFLEVKLIPGDAKGSKKASVPDYSLSVKNLTVEKLLRVKDRGRIFETFSFSNLEHLQLECFISVIPKSWIRSTRC